MTAMSQFEPVLFVTVTDAERARSFYRDVLGLTLVAEELPFAIVFDAHGTMLRVAISSTWKAGAGTVLGWQVAEIESVVAALSASGVKFEKYGMPNQDEHGIWTSPTGAKVAWFKDLDGNVLSLSEHPEAPRRA